MASRGRPQVPQAGSKARPQARELGLECRLQQRVALRPEPRTVTVAEDLRQPDLARAQHVGDQRGERRRFMVERACEPLERRATLVARFHRRHESPAGFAVQGPRIVHERRRVGDARCERKPLRQPVTQPVDRLDVKPGRIAFEVPAAGSTLLECCPGERMELANVGLGVLVERAGRKRQCTHDAVTHFRRRLAGESDRDNLLRAGD
jgi:hypothetical protein